ncbi:uncharacterized protein LOC125775904 [Bactrocera dorsalis]|uniref:Uncharacterized protein LOC125775904 n=1 Tax=Bactrocera dorsalis TaxID=27457 RepID=A0ABM3J0V2_BACDO|nr:uncharacterized protein LOC125775904 [Bactrocera dorsalis]
MKRHLQKDHSDIYDDKRAKIESSEVSKNDKRIKFTVEMSVNEVVNSCITLLTKQSVPLSHFDSEPFNTLTNPIFDGLHIPKINSRNILHHLKDQCDNLKNNIRNLTKNKILCLKMDTATRHDRAILGVNVQIITSNKLEIFTLAMLELKQKHTAQYLTTKIENVLKSFNIDKAQVYAVTTDNGRNMVKAVELLSLHSDDEESDSEIEDNYESIVCNVRFENIISIKCAAHTLQLAVKDFLDNLNTNVVNKSRNCVKYLRTPAYR